MVWDRKVPFTKKGNLITSGLDAGGDYAGEVDWRPLYTFKAVLTFQRFRFSWVVFTDEQGHKYSVTMKDFERLVPALMDGWVAGEWTFKKHGTYYYVVPVGR